MNCIYLKGRLEIKSNRVQEKDEAKTKVLIKAQSLILQLQLIKGRPQNPSFVSTDYVAKQA